MADILNRRPLKLRDWPIMAAIAKALSTRQVSPNAISIASIAFSALAGFFFLLFPIGGGVLWFCAIMMVLCLMGRGICNIADGMVAVEGGFATPSGELFNDIPDRISDALVLVCAGYAAGAPTLGWLAAVLAVMTAYTRTLARSTGAPPDFQGPMAKIQRMSIIAVAGILTPFEASFMGPGYLLTLALIVISIGCIWTIKKRARSAYDFLEGKARIEKEMEKEAAQEREQDDE